jgi:hypothetical protein
MTCPHWSPPRKDPPLPPLEKPDPVTIHDLAYLGLERSNVKIKRSFGQTSYWER